MNLNPTCGNCNKDLVTDLASGGHGMSECLGCKREFCPDCGMSMGHTKCVYCNKSKGFCGHDYSIEDFLIKKCKHCDDQ